MYTTKRRLAAMAPNKKKGDPAAPRRLEEEKPEASKQGQPGGVPDVAHAWQQHEVHTEEELDPGERPAQMYLQAERVAQDHDDDQGDGDIGIRIWVEMWVEGCPGQVGPDEEDGERQHFWRRNRRRTPQKKRTTNLGTKISYEVDMIYSQLKCSQQHGVGYWPILLEHNQYSCS